jgi:hypothetical protein
MSVEERGGEEEVHTECDEELVVVAVVEVLRQVCENGLLGEDGNNLG